MRERRNVPEIVIEAHELLRRSQTRINLLFTMSEIPHAHPVGRDVRSDVSRTMYSSAWVCPIDHLGCATRSPEGEAWWSQTGSNRRPHACKARALPAELWPRLMTNAFLRPSSPFGLCRARFTRLSRVAAPRVANGEAWWAWEDLNFRPHAYQARALTN